ncbi:TraR/DksA family transcriptional regulator [Sinosporangium siamense]|uniref:DksA/traR C4-type zinc finger family protein n=1 Tax=Sinosporangium siamense TaxID=1367973 RepID=A0A919V6H6_9ACTN|nr:TraR/DksA C4-type zinc finger protein [Sinosporangium siamense]GII92493.1 dksA/traR C4-type zinc finger family protein [Sinosporangium siamense]
MDDRIARTRLQDMLAKIERSIGVLRGDPVALRERSAADAGADLTDTDRHQAMLDVASKQRVAVIAALKRLEEGAYGRCLDCGKLVPEGRLEARPEAARCVQCQSKIERRR